MNNESINQHISGEERKKWNETSEKLAEHLKNGAHIPTPPESGNFYLGSDLQWHSVPVINNINMG